MRLSSNQDPVPASGTPPEKVIDSFADDREAGSVLGTSGPGGALRRGRDVEGQIAIDHSALRFQPLLTPGWGRQGIAYGPFPRRAGLLLTVSLTNGHNTSQATRNPERFIRRLWRWARGPDADPWPRRMLALVVSPRRKRLLRRFAWWLRCSGRFYDTPDINENLAVGWFPSEAPRDPKTEGCGFVIRAALGENGEACIRIGDQCSPMFRRLKNIRLYFVVALRQQGAVYYAAASEGAHGLAPFPSMRPIGIDPFNRDTMVYAGAHQCVLGQIGFRVDTRVHGIHVQDMPEFSTGNGSGQACDALIGHGPLRTQCKPWRVVKGDILRTEVGARARGEAIALLKVRSASGLIHILMESDDHDGAAGLIWRYADEQNYWLLKLSGRSVELRRIADGVETTVATDHSRTLTAGTIHSVQITDGYGQIGCYLDGFHLFGHWVEDCFGESSPGVGLWFNANGNVCLRDFESHPREIPMPTASCFERPWRRLGKWALITDQFKGGAGNLAGRLPQMGHGQWQRLVGRGSLEVEASGGARVRASGSNPNPGRTFHTVPWSDKDFADLEATITPPGCRRGQNERCRSGLVFWQDKDNYLSFTAYLDDDYNGASVALFTKRHGFEELYDAIWTMVDDMITWGKPFKLRVTFDGNRFVVLLDGEPIMERALTDLYPEDPPLCISQVGLATNWEWGDDTGSVFQSFTARS